MTKEQWQNDANLRPALAGILADQTMILALEIVLAQGLLPVNPPPGVDLIHFGAIQAFRRDGYLEAIANLKKLALITKRKPEEKKPWTVEEKDLPQEKFADDTPPAPAAEPKPELT